MVKGDSSPATLFFKGFPQGRVGCHTARYGKFMVAILFYRMEGMFHQHINDCLLKGSSHIRLIYSFPLHLAGIESVNVSDAIKTGGAGRDHDIQAYIETLENLGKADERYELYRIVPPDATGDTVMTYGTFQGFEIVSGTGYSPSAFALYLFDTQDKVMYTIEDGEGLADFSEVYRLLPQNMKKGSDKVASL